MFPNSPPGSLNSCPVTADSAIFSCSRNLRQPAFLEPHPGGSGWTKKSATSGLGRILWGVLAATEFGSEAIFVVYQPMFFSQKKAKQMMNLVFCPWKTGLEEKSRSQPYKLLWCIDDSWWPFLGGEHQLVGSGPAQDSAGKSGDSVGKIVELWWIFSCHLWKHRYLIGNFIQSANKWLPTTRNINLTRFAADSSFKKQPIGLEFRCPESSKHFFGKRSKLGRSSRTCLRHPS